MGKRIKIILVLVFIILCATLFIQVKSNEKTVYVYKINLISRDLILNNLKLITFGDKYYIDDSFTIKKIKDEENIRDVSMDIYSDKGVLTDKVFQFDILKTVEGESVLNNNVKITPDTIIKIRFRYKIDGVQEEYISEVPLKKYVKHKL